MTFLTAFEIQQQVETLLIINIIQSQTTEIMKKKEKRFQTLDKGLTSIKELNIKESIHKQNIYQTELLELLE